MSTQRFGFTLWFRPVAEFLIGASPDTRPVDRLPQIQSAPDHESAEARDVALEADITGMEAPQQGYRVERVERWHVCGRCMGSGRLRVRPKGWRKRTEPKWFQCREVTCECGTEGTVSESITHR